MVGLSHTGYHRKNSDPHGMKLRRSCGVWWNRRRGLLVLGGTDQFGRVASYWKMPSLFSRIPLGMHRSVENAAPLIQHPDRCIPRRVAAFGGIGRELRGYGLMPVFLGCPKGCTIPADAAEQAPKVERQRTQRTIPQRIQQRGRNFSSVRIIANELSCFQHLASHRQIVPDCTECP